MQPTTLRDRSGRLQMFARLKTENEAIANATAPKAQEPEKRLDAPQPVTSASERRELAEIARLPIPQQTTRQNAGHQRGFSQPPLEALRRTNSPSPVNHQVRIGTDARRVDLFSGSQLGESFMNSGLTTPHNEPEEPEPEPSPERRNSVVAPRGPSRNTFDGGFRTSDNAAFQLGDDLLMKVVTGARRHNPSHMNDGFHNGVINGLNKHNGDYKMDYGRPSSPAQKQPKLPMREVKIRSVHPARHIEYGGKDKRSSSPAFETKGWQMRHVDEDAPRPTARFQDQDGDASSSIADEEIHTTPKAKRPIPSPQKAVFDKAMPPAAVSFKSAKDKKRRRGSPDYDDMALNSMTYTALQSEPFDFDPSKATAHIGHGAGAGNLSTKLEQCRHQAEKEQRYMFSNLSVDDWEAAGDWFADQFAEIMHKLIEARRNKRRTIQEFEYEAAAREEAVRLRSDAIDRKLAKMKQDGQRVVNSNDT